MADGAKVIFSEFEAMLVSNSNWILTKHTIIQKVSELLAGQVTVINDVFMEQAAIHYPELKQCIPKISKGEKYLNLPYIILDYPARFSKTSVLALRTMFWWGNFVSVSLHLSGEYKKDLEEIICKNLSSTSHIFYLSTGKKEWEHHFEEDNYIPFDTLMQKDDDLIKKIVQPSFIKIALKYDLARWDNMDLLLKEAYSKIASIISY